MSEHDPRDLPTNELLALAQRTIDKHPKGAAQVFFKWTCGSCGARQTFETPNKWFTSGQCEECKAVTELTHGGFLLSVKLPKPK